jgi:hypothetical protein
MKDKTKSTLVYENKPTSIDTLFKLYKKNRYHARVFFKNNGKHQFIRKTTWLYEEGNDFSIVQYRKIHGISVTNRMYSRETVELRITYKKGKFWFITGASTRIKGVKHFTLSHVSMMENSEKIIKILIEKFPWVQFLMENNLLTHISVNTIKKQKLFTLKKALQYKYKTNYPTAKLLHLNSNYFTSFDLPKKRKYLKNFESIKKSWLNQKSDFFGYFQDTLRMAETLDRQVNCSWSDSRLKEEHDKWSDEITEIIYNEANRDLKIKKVFTEFRDFSNLNMLTTTKEMYLEGKKQSHCVGTYVQKVDNGRCAIFTYNKYTIEVGIKVNNQLYVVQCRGFRNKNADEESMSHINDLISQFNKIIQAKRVKEGGLSTKSIGLDEFDDGFHLPF